MSGWRVRKPVQLVSFIVFFFVTIAIIVFMLQEKLIFFPEVLPDNHRFSFQNHFEEKYFNCPSGNRIHALYFPAENAKGIVLYFHGNAGSLNGWGGVAADFLPLNYSVVIPDYPGYGKSRGKLSEKNLYSDAQHIFDVISKQHAGENITIYGRSIGSGIAAHLAHKNTARALILESPFFNLPDLKKKLFPFIPDFLLRYRFRTDQVIQKVSCPVYIIHGNSDEVVYFGSSLKLQELFKPADRLFAIDGGHHNDLSAFAGYYEALKIIL